MSDVRNYTSTHYITLHHPLGFFLLVRVHLDKEKISLLLAGEGMGRGGRECEIKGPVPGTGNKYLRNVYIYLYTYHFCLRLVD